MSNVHGLHSNRRDSDSDGNDDDEGHENRYVGGVDARGGGSGLAVEPNPDLGPSSSGSRGAASSDGIFANASSASSADGPISRTITMYRDGFVVDDGPYRRLDDPANKDFLESLARGVTPKELVQGDDGKKKGNVTVGLVDKRSQDYVPPEPTFQSFSGAGSALGTAASSSSSAAAGPRPGVIVPSSSPPSPPPPPDESRPSTSVQIRLLNGRRIVAKINLDSPARIVADHVESSGHGGSEPYVLSTGFPPRPIEDLSLSVEECGLKGAQVVQKKA